MSFEAGVQANPRIGVSRYGSGVADARSPRFRQPMEVIGRAYEPRSAAGPVSTWRLMAAINALLLLVLPVLLLIALGAASFLYADRPVRWLSVASANWLTWGHLMVPLTFFAIHLTNRRFGAAYAFLQTVLAWTLGAAALWAAQADLASLAGRALPDLHVALVFGGALFLGQVFSVLVFDRTRGPRWWTAPFFASLWGGVLFCLIAFPLAYHGTQTDWSGPMLTYAGIMAGSAFLLLGPYCLLRPVVPPMSGFGGY